MENISGDLKSVLQIAKTTISEVYSHYYAKGVFDFFLKHHSKENILSDIEKMETFLSMMKWRNWLITSKEK